MRTCHRRPYGRPDVMPIPESFLQALTFSDGSIVQVIQGVWYARAAQPPAQPKYLLRPDKSVRTFATATEAILALMVALPEPTRHDIAIVSPQSSPRCRWGRPDEAEVIA